MGSLEVILLSGTQSDVNIHTLLGSPTYPLTALVTVDVGAVITGLSSGSLAAGSILFLRNRGAILGHGGAGGQGDRVFAPIGPSTDGAAGEAAVEVFCNLKLAMTSGFLYGGGGGGAGTDLGFGGGNGGGGGVAGGPGGAPGVESVGTPEEPEYETGVPGTDGGAGVSATPGVGSGDAGDGGTWGAAGQNSSSNVGGAAGKAIELNGFSIDYAEASLSELISGNFLKGAVS